MLRGLSEGKLKDSVRLQSKELYVPVREYQEVLLSGIAALS